MSDTPKENKSIYEILENLREHVFELHKIQSDTNEKFIRELMNELKEAYNLIETLTKALEIIKPGVEGSSKNLQ